MQPVLHLLGVGDFPEKDHRWLIAFRQADPAALGAPFHWTAQYGTPERRQAVRVRAINHQVAHDKAHALSIAPAGVIFHRPAHCLGERGRRCRELLNGRSAWAPACPLVTVRYPG
jgi:hypothetical protein